jgi:hypothetical protein
MTVMNRVRRSLNKDKIAYSAQNIVEKNLLYICNNSVSVRKCILKNLLPSFHLTKCGEMCHLQTGTDKIAEVTLMDGLSPKYWNVSLPVIVS